MAAVTLYRLRPRGPLHFGAPGIGVEGVVPFPSAATFFSAWCWAIHNLAGVAALERLLAAYREGVPPFLLAAPLPWIDEVLLLPRAALPGPRAPEEAGDTPRDKRGKRYRWVEEGLWLRLLAGAPATADFQDEHAFHQGQTIWAASDAGAALRARPPGGAVDEAEPAFWRVAVLPHVTVDRATGAGSIHHLGTTWFAAGVGLALPVRWLDDSERDLLERALVLLGETGIGGERSAGYGQFDVTGMAARDWPDLTATPTAETFVTLAGYHPTVAETRGGVFGPPASYSFGRSRGWVERGTREHGVRLVETGSLLRRLPGQETYGELVDVTPDGWGHPVYRYGYAFPAPVASGEGG